MHPEHARATVLAEQLAEQQWKNNTTQEQTEWLSSFLPLRPPDPNIPTNNFTEQELQHAISQLKKNKAPGPDLITNEELKYLDEENTTTFLSHLNHCWNTGQIPKE